MYAMGLCVSVCAGRTVYLRCTAVYPRNMWVWVAFVFVPEEGVCGVCVCFMGQLCVLERVCLCGLPVSWECVCQCRALPVSVPGGVCLVQCVCSRRHFTNLSLS